MRIGSRLLQGRSIMPGADKDFENILRGNGRSVRFPDAPWIRRKSDE
jgi:hypothetical protein